MRLEISTQFRSDQEQHKHKTVRDSVAAKSAQLDGAAPFTVRFQDTRQCVMRMCVRMPRSKI